MWCSTWVLRTSLYRVWSASCEEVADGLDLKLELDNHRITGLSDSSWGWCSAGTGPQWSAVFRVTRGRSQFRGQQAERGPDRTQRVERPLSQTGAGTSDWCQTRAGPGLRLTDGQPGSSWTNLNWTLELNFRQFSSQNSLLESYRPETEWHGVRRQRDGVKRLSLGRDIVREIRQNDTVRSLAWIKVETSKNDKRHLW